MSKTPLLGWMVSLLTLAALVACGGGGGGASQGDASSSVGGSQAQDTARLKGTIEVDGSSTVFPITEAMAEEFRRVHPGVQINVGVSGTGGGFKRFTVGETDISDASRPIKEGERRRAAENGVEFIELKVGLDGLAVVVNPANDFVECMTIDELRRIWEPGSAVRRWSDVRPQWPDEPIRLYGPGTDSGTFDFFTEAVVGEARASRADYTASEDDNVLVQGISGDRNALGYFGYAYYIENRDRLKVVAVDAGDGCVEASDETVASGRYPLARPLFIYVNRRSLARPEVRAFVRFYLEKAPELVHEVGYTPLPQEEYRALLQKLEEVEG